MNDALESGPCSPWRLSVSDLVWTSILLTRLVSQQLSSGNSLSLSFTIDLASVELVSSLQLGNRTSC